MLQNTAKSGLQTRATSLDECRVMSERGELFAILDACDAPAVPKQALELGGQRAISLYQGTAQQEHWEIAPYLMQVDSAMLDWIIRILGNQPWGILVFSKSDLDRLRRHFRHFLMVQSPTSEQWYFRFYDPRVLKTFLSTCLDEQLAILGDPVSGLGVVDEGLEMVTIWWNPISSPQRPEPSTRTSSLPLLKIRQEQVDAFKPQAENAFATEMIAYLKEQLPECIEGLSNDVLRQRVRTSIARAQAYGLKLEWTLTAFIATMFSVAPNFDEQENIHRALTDERVAPDDRMDHMLEVTTEQDWDKAEQAYDPKAWESAIPMQGYGKR